MAHEKVFELIQNCGLEKEMDRDLHEARRDASLAANSCAKNILHRTGNQAAVPVDETRSYCSPTDCERNRDFSPVIADSHGKSSTKHVGALS